MDTKCFYFLGTIRYSVLERARAINLFAKLGSTEFEIRQQIISTRLFLVLLIGFIVVALSYYASEQIMTTYDINSPTYEQFIQMQSNQHINSSLL